MVAEKSENAAIKSRDFENREEPFLEEAPPVLVQKCEFPE